VRNSARAGETVRATRKVLEEQVYVRYVAIGLLLIAPSFAPAQEVTGSITGTVTDPTGSIIAHAVVRLISEATGVIRALSTDNEGNFVFTAVPPGFYTVAAEHPGFKKYQKQRLELTPGDTLGAGNLKLSVGACWIRTPNLRRVRPGMSSRPTSAGMFRTPGKFPTI